VEQQSIRGVSSVLVRYALSTVLVIGSGNSLYAQPNSAPTNAESAANAPGKTPSGHTFVIPKDWAQSRRDGAVILQAPERGSWIALIELDAPDATRAIEQAWKVYRGSDVPELSMSVPLANQNGWVDGKSNVYRVPAGEPRQLTARAMRAVVNAASGDASRVSQRWVVRIDDLANAVAGKRSADLTLIRGEFLPAGYVRESFAKRKTHVLSTAKIDELKAFVSRSQQQLEVPGVSIGVVQGGKVVFAGGFGVREHGKPDSVDADTLYLIASNTKSLSSLMLAKLVDEGKFKWTTPVVELMPIFKLADAELTRKVEVRHLSCACAGLPYRNMDWEYALPNSPASLTFDILAKMRPTSAFGTTYQYSNPPAAASGFVGGHVAFPTLEIGKAYDQAMMTRVFEPLGMTRTTFDYDHAMRGNFARSHGVGIDGNLELVDPRRDRQMHAVRPTGGAWSNVNDLLAYVQLELTGGLLANGKRHISTAALHERWKSQIATGRHAWYGLGLDTDLSSGTPMLYHGGRLYGQRTNMAWWPEHDIGVVVLTNSSTGNVLMDAVPRKLMEILFDGQPEADSMVNAAAASERERRVAWRRGWTYPAKSEDAQVLASRYRNDLLGELRVERSQGHVHIHFAAWGAPVASRTSASGAVEFVFAIPSPPPAFVAGKSKDGPTLTMRDAQNEYVFTEVVEGR
jgi:CubicO group peptidase (beta-lactamase class C family)